MSRSVEPAPSSGGPVRPGRLVGLVVFGLAPVLSLGFGSWLAFLVAAIRYSYLGRWAALLLWASTSGYLAAALVMVATSARIHRAGMC